VIKNLILAKRHTLVVGNVGVGKTLVIGTVLETLPEGLSAFTMNFSAQTSSNSCQVGFRVLLQNIKYKILLFYIFFKNQIYIVI
jgi:dynein heavy chain